jgi:hypothetical protein
VKFEPQQLILVGGLVLVAFWFFVRAQRKGSGGSPPAPAPGSAKDRLISAEEQIERIRQSRGMHGDLERLMNEIEDLTKRLGQRLDAKADNLERLIREADAKIAELRRLQGEAPLPGGPTSFEPRDGFEAPRLKLHTDAAPPDDPLARDVYAMADAGKSSIEIARNLNEQVGKVELILALRKA